MFMKLCNEEQHMTSSNTYISTYLLFYDALWEVKFSNRNIWNYEHMYSI